VDSVFDAENIVEAASRADHVTQVKEFDRMQNKNKYFSRLHWYGGEMVLLLG
jgi:hypothetical protein